MRAPAYHPGLDGLRGVAVAMVLVFHSGLGWLTGGFLGVSIFFTLSGFLITSLLLAEVEDRERLDFRAFWGRRLRRLLPASLVAIIAVVLVTPFLSTAIEESRIRGDAISAVLYVSNWRYVQAGMSYEELFASASPLLHLWSLSIEAQMYVVVPLMVMIGWALGLRRRGLALLMVVATGISVVVGIFMVDGDRLYYGTDARAAELLVGSALACLWSGSPRASERESLGGKFAGPIDRWMPVIGLAAALVIASVTTTSSTWVYSGALGAFALISAVLVVGSIESGPLRNLLGIKPLVIIGRVSYGLYLYHWPIFVWMTPERVDVDGVALFAARLLATALVTGLSYVFIETPIRRRRWLVTPSSTLVAAGVAVVLAIAIPVALLHPYRSVVESEQEVLTTVAPNATTANSSSPGESMRIVVLGDSTAENLARAFADVADPRLGVIGAGVIGCPLLPVERVHDRPGSTQDATYCPDNLEIVRRYRSEIDAVVIVAGVANQWDFERAESADVVRVGSDRYLDLLVEWMDDVQAVLAEVGVPVLIFDAPETRMSDTVLGDEPEAVAAWNAVITLFDERWVSVRRVPFGQYLSDPNSDAGRLERPDGVHLDRQFAADLARTALVPSLHQIYEELRDEMDRTACRVSVSTDAGRWVFDLAKCRS